MSCKKRQVYKEMSSLTLAICGINNTSASCSLTVIVEWNFNVSMTKIWRWVFFYMYTNGKPQINSLLIKIRPKQDQISQDSLLLTVQCDCFKILKGYRRTLHARAVKSLFFFSLPWAQIFCQNQDNIQSKENRKSISIVHSHASG